MRGPGRADDGAGLQVADDAVAGVHEREEHVVDGRRGAGVQLGVHLLDRAEQLDGRVDQVRAEVEQEPARGRGRSPSSGPAARDGTSPSAARTGAPCPARPLASSVEQGELLGVPAAVLEHGEPSVGRGDAEQLGVVGGGGQRLVDEHVQRRRRAPRATCATCSPVGLAITTRSSSSACASSAVDVGDDERSRPVRLDLLARRLRVTTHGHLLTGLAQQPGVDAPARSPVPDQPDPQRLHGASL